ncbi:hypothetical protein [Emcibacter nanhaiensis]|uniref:Uncharacterized protein n=1 Tax=Emcibacter nanhaiensis TaxID=1505037 RepID=A0A501PCR4_9PROT|nr:hypothetical protein [Emcibacter nanhaiensis]TPD57694.1 hypothetical protein FIV46_16445 [Emcibacter nanhaiensis]
MISDIVKVTGYSPFKTLLLREFWENRRSMFYGPMVTSSIFVGLILIVLFSAYFGLGQIGVHSDEIEISDLAGFANEDLETRRKAIGIFLMGSSILTIIVAWFSMVFNSLGSLYDERKDNSILFWKSMPVSDTQTVLSKMLSNVFITPLIALGFIFATQIIVLAILCLIGLIAGQNPWELFIVPANLPNLFARELTMVIMYCLWALPVFAYLMLASTVAKRTPLLTAIVPVAVIIVVELYLYGHSYLGHGILEHISAEKMFDLVRMGDDEVVNLKDTLVLIKSAALPSFWFGLAAAAAMLWGAIQLRKRSNQ